MLERAADISPPADAEEPPYITTRVAMQRQALRCDALAWRAGVAQAECALLILCYYFPRHGISSAFDELPPRAPFSQSYFEFFSRWLDAALRLTQQAKAMLDAMRQIPAFSPGEMLISLPYAIAMLSFVSPLFHFSPDIA